METKYNIQQGDACPSFFTVGIDRRRIFFVESQSNDIKKKKTAKTSSASNVFHTYCIEHRTENINYIIFTGYRLRSYSFLFSSMHSVYETITFENIFLV